MKKFHLFSFLILLSFLLLTSLSTFTCNSRGYTIEADEDGALSELTVIESSDGGQPDTHPTDRDFPHLAALPKHRELILDRIDREPYGSILKEIVKKAELVEKRSPENIWDVDINGYNAKIAQANAFLAWVYSNSSNAQKAINILKNIETHFEKREKRSDIDVNMPQVIMGFINALDFLKGTDFLTKKDEEIIERKILSLIDKFYNSFIEDDFVRTVQLNYSQNNHNIRTASAIGYAAIAFKDYPSAKKWLNWAFSELDFFFNPENYYFMPDGSISEGPFYGMFAMQSSAILFIALSNLKDEVKVRRDCRTRIYSDPWQNYICNEGEIFKFENPIYKPLFHKFFEWYFSIRLPWGDLPPLEDSMFKTYGGTMYLNSFGGDSTHYWMWKNNRDFPYMLDQSDDMAIYNLIYFDDRILPKEPNYTTKFMPEAGHIVFRSDWSYDAIWLLLTAESGAQRKAAHDHVDGTSFSLAAYGEYLLIDPGYVKDENSTIFKVKTAQPQAHNVILIDGKGAPEKEAFPNYGDTDAYLTNFIDAKNIDYIEAHQHYQNAHIKRAFIFVDNRYFVVADFIQSEIESPREYRWRLSGYAGYGSGGRFEITKDKTIWERKMAGVEVYLSSPDGEVEITEPPFIKGEIPHVHKFDINRETTEHGVIDGVINTLSPYFLALLLPYRVGADNINGPIKVEPVIPSDAVVSYVIEYDGYKDIVIQRKEISKENFIIDDIKIDTDAILVVFRYKPDFSFVVASSGTYLSINGKKIIDKDFANDTIILP